MRAQLTTLLGGAAPVPTGLPRDIFDPKTAGHLS